MIELVVLLLMFNIILTAYAMWLNHQWDVTTHELYTYISENHNLEREVARLNAKDSEDIDTMLDELYESYTQS